MGDKVFKSNIRLKYNYSNGKVGNTLFRPYVYDSSGTSNTMSDSFLSTDMVHPLNTLSDDYKLRYSIGNKDNYPDGGRRYFLFFKGTNGVNSMFSASNSSMVEDIDKNRDVRIPSDKRYLNSYIINKHDLRFDKGTLKYKDKYNNIYTVEGLGNFASEKVDDFSERGHTLYGYGQPVRHYSFTSGNSASFSVDSKRFKNNGYSSFMLIIHFSVKLTSGSGNSGIFTVYCFVPVCFYDLSLLNDGRSSAEWQLGSELLGSTKDRYAYSTSLYIYNFEQNGNLDKRIWGGNGFNITYNKYYNTRELARNVPDVHWTSPNGNLGTSGNFIPPDIYNDYSKRSGFRCMTSISMTAYHMSEMSYKYYMYGDGKSQWRGKRGNMYMVKWYPTNDVEVGQPNYFLENDGYIY